MEASDRERTAWHLSDQPVPHLRSAGHFPLRAVKTKYFDKKALQVVGIAEGREEAIFLVQQMLQDTVDAGMEADIKGYLQKTFTSGKGGGG